MIMDYSQPLPLYQTEVSSEWVDEFDHMNLAHYVAVCDEATYKFWEIVNDNQPLHERNGMEYAIVETHVNYIREARLGDPLEVKTQLLAFDQKRFNLFHNLYNTEINTICATNEVMALGFNLNIRNIQPFQDSVQKQLTEIFKGHRKLERPANAGRGISMPTKQ